MTKKELITEICNKLNERGFTDEEPGNYGNKFKTDKGFCKTLNVLQESVLLKIVSADLRQYKSFEGFYNALGREGVWKFTPYLIQLTNGKPGLVIRRNRIATFGENYKFRVCCDVDGKDLESQNSHSLRFLFEDGEPIFQRSFLSYILLLAGAYQCCCTYDNFNRVFDEINSTFNHFVKYTVAPYKFDFTGYIMQQLDLCISDEDFPIDYEMRPDLKYYDIMVDGKPYANMAVGGSKIYCQYCKKSFCFNIPDVANLVCNGIYSEEEITHAREILQKSRYKEILFLGILNSIGIQMDFLNDYTLDAIWPVKHMNAPKVVQVHNLNDIYEQL